MENVAHQYVLHESSILDCLQPGHLPKYEQMKNYVFIILRVYHPDKDIEADSVLELTNKVAVFMGSDFIITVHRKEWNGIQHVADEHHNYEECKSTKHLLGKIMIAALHTYDDPGQRLTRNLEVYEKKVFLAERQVTLIKHLYYIKRKLDVIKRLLLLSHEVVDNFDKPEVTNAFTRDVRDLYIKQKNLFDSLAENVNQLLNVYFNISAQRTNDTMRVLTIFSVFFMPLTFIVGVYGMNFKHMPELDWEYGYPAAMALMAVIIIVIFIWFRHKKWL